MSNKANTKDNETVRFALRLPPDLHGSLKNVAEQDNRSINSQIITFIEQALQCREQAANQPTHRPERVP